jgi:hypothetical protein
MKTGRRELRRLTQRQDLERRIQLEVSKLVVENIISVRLRRDIGREMFGAGPKFTPQSQATIEADVRLEIRRLKTLCKPVRRYDIARLRQLLRDLLRYRKIRGSVFR